MLVMRMMVVLVVLMVLEELVVFVGGISKIGYPQLKKSKINRIQKESFWRKKHLKILKTKSKIHLYFRVVRSSIPLVTTLKNSNWDKNQTIKLWQNSKTQIVTKLKNLRGTRYCWAWRKHSFETHKWTMLLETKTSFPYCNWSIKIYMNQKPFDRWKEISMKILKNNSINRRH